MRNRFFIFCALATLAALLTGCSRRAASDEGQSASSENTVAEVTLTRVERADIRRPLTLTGTIAAVPNRDVRVSALVPGRIAALNVAEGDVVTAGQLLAQIDDRPYRDQLEQAEAAVAQSKAALENARLSLARNENLFSRGIAARKDVEDARTQASVTEAAERQAEAALSLARRQLSRTEVLSPIAGFVVRRFVSVGEQVDGTAAQPVAEVADRKEVELLANVPTPYLSKLRAGTELTITSEIAPGHALTGRVVALSPAVDAATNAGLARIRIANHDGLLRLGMFLTAQVPIETHAGALVLPPQAVYRDAEGHPRVFRVEGDAATAVSVTIGIETPERVEITSGVTPGETVILTGGYGLGEKSKVRVKGAASP